MRRGVRLAEALGHSYTLGIACWGLGHLYSDWGRPDDAIRVLERALAVGRTANIAVLTPFLASLMAATYARSGRPADAAALIPPCPGLFGSGSLYHAVITSFNARTYLRLGRLPEAATVAREAMESARAGQYLMLEATVAEVLGDISAAADRPDAVAAEEHYRQALAVGVAQGWRPLVASCQLGLGKLYAGAGRTAAARTCLTEARMAFGEMKLTPGVDATDAALEETGAASA